MCFHSHGPHFTFGILSKWKQQMAELLLANLGKEVGLVFYRVYSCAEPEFSVSFYDACVVAVATLSNSCPQRSSKYPNFTNLLHIMSGCGVRPSFTVRSV